MQWMQSEPGSEGGWRPPKRLWVPVAGVAAVVLVVVATLAVAGLLGRSSTPGDAAVVVMPPAQGATQPAPGTTAGPAAGDVAAPSAAAGAAAAGAVPDRSSSSSAAAPSSYSLPIVGSSCSASPTVQFQGRGLAATGVAAITGGETVGTVTVTVQQSGSDLGSVLSTVQARLAAVQDALARAGVTGQAIQVSSFRTYGDSLGRQYTAYASLVATVTGVDALTNATRAVAQIQGVSAYSQSSPVAGEPTEDQVEDAVRRAAAQARQMAESTAGAAGVGLGDARSVVAQPPMTCYGATGPQRIVQVTSTYAIR